MNPLSALWRELMHCSKCLVAIPNARAFAERALRNIRPRSRGSLRLDAGELDHLGPLLGFGSDVLAEISGWATERCGAEVGKPRLHPGIGQGRVDCPVEGFDNLCRRALRRTEAAPEARLITRQEVDQGRDFRECLRACGGGHRQSA